MNFLSAIAFWLAYATLAELFSCSSAWPATHSTARSNRESVCAYYNHARVHTRLQDPPNHRPVEMRPSGETRDTDKITTYGPPRQPSTLLGFA